VVGDQPVISSRGKPWPPGFQLAQSQAGDGVLGWTQAGGQEAEGRLLAGAKDRVGQAGAVQSQGQGAAHEGIIKRRPSGVERQIAGFGERRPVDLSRPFALIDRNAIGGHGHGHVDVAGPIGALLGVAVVVADEAQLVQLHRRRAAVAWVAADDNLPVGNPLRQDIGTIADVVLRQGPRPLPPGHHARIDRNPTA